MYLAPALPVLFATKVEILIALAAIAVLLKTSSFVLPRLSLMIYVTTASPGFVICHLLTPTLVKLEMLIVEVDKVAPSPGVAVGVLLK